jgi:ParB/Sulfiredoxin domain
MSTRSATRLLSLPTAAAQADEPDATSASAVRNIPLDRLVPSPNNVRKAPPSAAEDAELKASIRAVGLKQNLVVHRVPDADGTYAVTAGAGASKPSENSRPRAPSRPISMCRA